MTSKASAFTVTDNSEYPAVL